MYVLLIAEPGAGGTGKYVSNAAQGLSGLGHRVTIAFSPKRVDQAFLAARARLQSEFGIEYIEVDMTRSLDVLGDLRSGLAVRRLLASRRWDIVHAHSSKAGFLARTCRLSKLPPVVYSPHGLAFLQTTGPLAWLYLSLERIAAPRTSHFVAVTDRERDVLLQTGLCRSPGAVTVVPGALRSNFGVEEPPSPARYPPSWGPKCFVIGAVGSLEAKKAPLDLLEAFIRVCSALPHARLVWVGDGSLRPDFESRVVDAGLEDKVWLVGAVADVEPFLVRMDLFVLPSRFDERPYALLEALLVGVPCIATTAIDPGILESRVLAAAVPPAAPRDLADAILLTIGRAPEDLRAIAQSGRLWARAFTSQDTMAEALQWVYYRVLEGGRRTADRSQ